MLEVEAGDRGTQLLRALGGQHDVGPRDRWSDHADPGGQRRRRPRAHERGHVGQGKLAVLRSGIDSELCCDGRVERMPGGEREKLAGIAVTTTSPSTG